MTNAFFVDREIRRHQNFVSIAGTRLRSARKLMDVVHTANSVPSAPAYLRGLSQLRSVDSAFQQEVEKTAKTLIEAEISNLRTRHPHMSATDFSAAVALLRRDMRSLNPYAPLAVRAGHVELEGFLRDIENPGVASYPRPSN